MIHFLALFSRRKQSSNRYGVLVVSITEQAMIDFLIPMHCVYRSWDVQNKRGFATLLAWNDGEELKKS